MRTTAIGSVAALFLAVPAWATDAKPEIDFVTRASLANLTAIAESDAAVDRASDPKLKVFARQLITAHKAAQAELTAAAEGSGAPVPTGLDSDHLKRTQTLQSQTGAAFDDRYVAEQAEIHSNALTLYADYMLLGDDAKLKAFAIKMIPITQAQFNTVQSLSRP